MSFEFKWPQFSPAFYEHAKLLLFNALNKGKKPAIITDRISVVNLDMGTIPPDLEILEIGDLGTDRFRGIFRMTYAGDASICLQTKVQANPLRQKTSTATPDILTRPAILFASTPLIVPMTLTLSALKLRAIVVLVISRLEGVTLVFKNDPLESVQVSSTFDSVSAIQAFLQAEIERQLRELFRTELPGIVHQLSRKWLRNSVASPSTESRDPPSSTVTPAFDISALPPAGPSPVVPDENTLSIPCSDGVPDQVESYDPTYGLRPSHPPLTGCFIRYRSLIQKKSRSTGLGAILTSTDDEEQENEHAPTLEGSTTACQSLQGVPHRCFDVADTIPPGCTASATPRQKPVPLSASSTPRVPRPRIFHFNSAGLIDSHASSSAVSSLLGQGDDSPSIRRASSSKPQGGLSGVPEHREESHSAQKEGDLLRSRRMERFSVHSKTSSGRFFSPLCLRQSSQVNSPRIGTSPLPSPRPTIYTQKSSFSGLPSTITQPTSLSSFNSYLDHFPTDVSKHPGSSPPIFLTSRSTSMGERSELNFDGSADGESSGQCALLASLVRGNCTLSPFSRSISHFASRSTPLSPQRKKGNLTSSRQTPVAARGGFLMNHHLPPSCLNRQVASEGSRCCLSHGMHLNHQAESDQENFCWGEQERLGGLKQKRLIRLGKLS